MASESSATANPAAAASEQLALDKLGLDKIASAFRGTNLSASKALACVTVILSTLHVMLPSIDETFALIPHHTLISPVVYCPVPFFWNLLTSHLFEGSVLKAAVTLPWVFLLSNMLERLWASQAIAVHVAFSTTLAGAFYFIVELTRAFSPDYSEGFFLPARGCLGLIVALGVALRHAYPFEQLPLLPKTMGWQCQHVPFAVAATAILLGLLMPWWFPEWPFAPCAMLFSWLHIRYFMWFPHKKEYGDHSAEFEFAALFPRPLQPFIGVAGALTYGICMLLVPSYLRLRDTDMSAASDAPSGQHFSSAQSLPLPHAASEPAVRSREYDMRRAKALELLDANLQSLLNPQAGRAESVAAAVDEEAPVMLVPSSDGVAADNSAAVAETGDVVA